MVTIWFDTTVVSTSALLQLSAGVGTAGLTLDAALNEKRSRKVTLTKHPIESGAKPADHAELDPVTYSVEGIITGVPIADADQKARNLVGPALVANDTGRGIKYSLFGGKPLDGSYAKAALDLLDAILEARSTVQVTTEMKVYSNMMLTGLDDNRDSSTGEAIHFTATFEEVRFVQTQAVRLQPPKAKDKTKTTGEDKQGKKVAPPVVDNTILKKVTNVTGLTKPGDGLVLPVVH